MPSSRSPSFELNAVGVAIVLALAAIVPATVAAQTPAPAATGNPGQKSLQLPPAPVAVTLRAIAAGYGVKVQFDEAVLADKRAREVSGFYAPQEALVQALRGTGLVAVVQDGGFNVVDQGVAGTLQPVVVVARRDQAETEFKADRSDTATRSGASLLDVPESVTIITGKLIESQQIITVQEALSNVSGVVLTNNVQGTPFYSIRGFSDNSNALVNGTESAFGTSAAVSTVERIEVLKGPQAILAGNGFPGGAVNVVLKKPQATPIKDVTLQYGTHEDKLISGDFSGVLGSDSRLTYRLIGADAGSNKAEGGYDGRKEKSLLPEVRWKDSSLDLTAGLSWLENHVPFSNYTFFLPAAGGKAGAIVQRPNVLLANSGDGFDLKERKAFYNGEYGFGHGLTLVSRMQRSLDTQVLSAYLPQQRGPFDQANPSIFFVGSKNDVETNTTSGDHYLRLEADTGPISQTIALGFNHSDISIRTLFGQDLTGGVGVNVDVTSPVQPRFPATTSLPQSIVNVNDIRQRGGYLQDTLRWGDVTALVSWRRTNYDQVGVTTFNGRVGAPSPHNYGRGDPSVGVVYSVTPNASVYANFMKGMTATFATGICGAPVTDPAPPRNYQNKEVGGKLDLLDNRLSITSAVYQLDETNTLSFNNAGRCYFLIPAQRTKGLEFDVQGRLAPGWNVVANYSNSLIHNQSTPTTVYYGHPRTQASLWTTYDFLSGPLQGAGAGFGVTTSSASYTQAFGSPPVDVPRAVSLNANLSYRRDGWAAILGVKNLTDRLNYGPSITSNYIPILQGRTITLTVRKSFE